MEALDLLEAMQDACRPKPQVSLTITPRGNLGMEWHFIYRGTPLQYTTELMRMNLTDQNITTAIEYANRKLHEKVRELDKEAGK